MEKQVIEQTVRQTVADVLGISADQIQGDQSPHAGDWESVQNLNIILALETSLGVEFSPEQMEKMRSIRQIVDVVKEQIDK